MIVLGGAVRDVSCSVSFFPGGEWSVMMGMSGHGGMVVEMFPKLFLSHEQNSDDRLGGTPALLLSLHTPDPVSLDPEARALARLR